MLKKILIGLGVVIVGLLIVVSMQPAEMNFSRELFIKSNPEKLFPYLSNSKKSNEWMPWSDVDPQLVMKYSGPEEGIGSASSWESPGQMGSGQSEIVETIPLQSVKTKLTYTKPMVMSQMAITSLKPVDGGTVVRWEVTGKNSFIGRFIFMFIDMDKKVGSQFERGLEKLKALVESEKTL